VFFRSRRIEFESAVEFQHAVRILRRGYDFRTHDEITSRCISLVPS
jgi:hypothetical protein